MKIELIPLLSLPREMQLVTRDWRNSAHVAEYFKIKYIDKDTHEGWLRSQEAESPRCIAYVICCESQYVGLTYFHSIDRKKGVADWGIYIHNPSARGKGVGKYALTKCMEIALYQLGLHTIYLDVLKSNMSAVRLYEGAGFVYLADEEDGFARYSLDLRLIGN